MWINVMKKIVVFACCLLLAAGNAVCQNSEINDWLKALDAGGANQVFDAGKIADAIGRSDTLVVTERIQQLEKKAPGLSLRIQARVQALKARTLFYKLGPGDSLYTTVMKEALDKAYRLNDYYMIAEFSRWYGEMLNSMGEKPLAALYCMNSLKIQEEMGFEHFPNVQRFYLTTAELLYVTRNYRAAANYYLRAFTLSPEENDNKEYYANSLNTLGKCYHHIKQYDSSLYYYRQCMAYVKKTGIKDDWYYSASDNRFEPFLELKMYDSCKVIADDLYKEGLPADNDLLTSACYMYARIAIRNRQFDEGLKWSLKSEQYAGTGAEKRLLAVYYDIAYCYEKLGKMDKALPYYKRNRELMEVNEQMSRKADVSFLEAQSNFEKTQAHYIKIKQDKENQLRLRNLLTGLLVAVALVVLFVLNKKRKKIDKARQQAEQQSHFFKTKYQSATQQLEAFRNDIIEKNTLIDRLQEELENRQLTADKNVETITKLSSQVLLTENDWQQFKTTFDSVYPHFFTTLKTSYSEITNAELRMASLIKLNFDTRHIASMLGISQDSVHKTRYRLRKRINDNGIASLEELIAAL